MAAEDAGRPYSTAVSMANSPSQLSVATPGGAWGGSATPRQRRLSISDLPISTHIGPEMDLPPKYTSMTVDEQIADAKLRIETQKIDGSSSQNLELPYKVKPYTKGMVDGLAANAVREKDRILGVLSDSRYRELLEFSVTLDRGESASGWMGEEQETFRRAFKKLQVLIENAPSSHAMKRQLHGTYIWYRASIDAMAESNATTGPGAKPQTTSAIDEGGPHFFELGPEELAADGQLPGSAFFSAPRGDEQEGWGRSDLPPQPLAAQLPSARERLRQVRTKQVATPTGFKPMHIPNFREASRQASPLPGSMGGSSRAASPDCWDRPFTPSTAFGGSTARTASSARSTPSPMPLPSRPTSAASGYRRPLTASSARGPAVVAQRSLLAAGLPPRPGTSCGLSSRDRGGGAIPEERSVGGAGAEATARASSAATYPVEPWKTEKEPMTVAELRMEERWLQYRQKDVAEKLMAEERRSMLKTWSERRARVEEEIARNAETARYQSELRRRGYGLPENADEDIEASSPSRPGFAAPGAVVVADEGEGEELTEEAVPGRAGPGMGLASGSATAAVRRNKKAEEVPRFNVSKIAAKQGSVQFTWNGGAGGAAKPKPPVSDRATWLRQRHKRLLDPPPEAYQTTSAASNAAALRAAALAAAADDEKRAEGGGGDGSQGGEEGASEPGSRGDVADEGLPFESGAVPAATPEEPRDDGGVDDDDEGAFGNVFMTDEGLGYMSLSPYTFDREEEAERRDHGDAPLRRADDSDVLATVCHHWRDKHGLVEEDLKHVGMKTGLEELRFRQLREAESIKRVFARINRPMDGGVLDRALVMPVHRITGVGATMKATANNLPSNPFFKPPQSKKKKKKKGGGKKIKRPR